MRGNKKCVSALLGVAACATLSFGLISRADADGAGTRMQADAAAAAVSNAHAGDIRISLDQAFPIRLGSPAAGVAVGNPNVAGVSVQDDHLLFVTGKAYGTTNLVIVGENGRMLYSGRIIVGADEDGGVMVVRGTQVERLTCSPICREHSDVGGAGASASGGN
jgi:Flp pilus assembly secretin CpaC